MKDDDELPNELIERLRTDYNPPPETPRDEMWSVIEGRLEAERRAGGLRVRRIPTPVRWALAASVILLTGVALGRWSAATPGSAGAPGPDEGSTAVLDPADRSGALRAVTASHMVETESLLRLVRSDARREGRLDDEVGAWGERLLSRTRLLLDAEEGGSYETRRLLEDLELILIQVVLAADDELPEPRRRGELEWLTQDLDEQNMLPRLQAIQPGPGFRFAGS